LHYNYFRYYDPSLGRYITSDPIGLEGGLNTYAYVGGNPLRLIDPFGLYLECSYWSGKCKNIDPNNIPLNFSVGVGGSAIFLMTYNSADSGIALDTTGNICLYSTLCTGLGWNTPLGGELGTVGSVGVGELCSGQQTSDGAYWAGGVGVIGQGQIFENGTFVRGLYGFGGSPEGPMSGVGGLSCTTTYECLFK